MRWVLPLILVTTFLAAAIACGGETEPVTTCVGRAPPPLASTHRIWRLDRLNLGEVAPDGGVDRTLRGSLGYNLDGLCSSVEVPTSYACRRTLGAIKTTSTDGPDGIDNSFARWVWSLYEPFDTKPSVTGAGRSFLEVETTGRAKLHLGAYGKAELIIELVQARLSEPDATGFVTLSAIAPREELVRSALAFMPLLSPADFCRGGSTQEGVINSLRQAADIPVTGVPNPDVECDGISFAMTFVGTPVDAMPVPRPSPCVDAGPDADDATDGD